MKQAMDPRLPGQETLLVQYTQAMHSGGQGGSALFGLSVVLHGFFSIIKRNTKRGLSMPASEVILEQFFRAVSHQTPS